MAIYETDTKSTRALILDFSASRAVRKKFLLFQSTKQTNPCFYTHNDIYHGLTFNIFFDCLRIYSVELKHLNISHVILTVHQTLQLLTNPYHVSTKALDLHRDRQNKICFICMKHLTQNWNSASYYHHPSMLETQPVWTPSCFGGAAEIKKSPLGGDQCFTGRYTVSRRGYTSFFQKFAFFNYMIGKH